MKGAHVLSGRRPDGAQTLPIRKCRHNRASEGARLDVIIDGMDAVDQRSITLDARPAAQRRCSAHGGLIGPETLPADPLRRPYEMRAPTSCQILLKRQRGVRNVDRIALPAQREQLRKTSLPDRR